MSVHEKHPRMGLVSTWPIRTEPMPDGPLLSMVTCGCDRHVAYCKAMATRMGLTARYYPDASAANAVKS